jgi:prophage DNA circulation protein
MWLVTLQQASFRGVPFDLIGVEDETQRAVVEHVVPYQEGVQTEDMGREGHRFRVSAWLWGPAYEVQLQFLAAALDQSGPGDFIHPIYGVKQVSVLNWRVSHEAESPDQCQVEMEFVESLPGVALYSVLGALANADLIGNLLGEGRNWANNKMSGLMSGVTSGLGWPL